MTKEDLEKIGIIYIGDKVYPDRFHVPCLGEVNLRENTNIKDIFEMIWKAGNEYGQKQGKKLKIIELKKVLEIDLD